MGWVRRRQFLISAAALLAAPLAAEAQQPGGARRIGLLMAFVESDAEIQSRITIFRQELRKLGWAEGGNLRIDERWASDNMDRVRAYAAELIGLKPDAIVVAGRRAVSALQKQTSTIPIVFLGISDPMGAGIVPSLARPGGNITGFALIDFQTIGKMLEALKQLAPKISHAALIFNPDNPASAFFSRSFETTATSLGVKPITFPIHDPAEIENAIKVFARQPNGGLLFPPDVTVTTHRELVIASVALHRLPAIYADAIFVKSGGLSSYGPDRSDISRGAAAYVDRILRGENAGDLPVQQPTKYELLINLKAAKALGLKIPQSVLLRADRVIE